MCWVELDMTRFLLAGNAKLEQLNRDSGRLVACCEVSSVISSQLSFLCVVHPSNQFLCPFSIATIRMFDESIFGWSVPLTEH